jgi:predicted nucleic acid-binding protein
MTKAVPIVIQDANALIDLVNGDLLGSWFRLGYETSVTDFVLYQATRQMSAIQPFVDAGMLRVVEVSDDISSEVYSRLIELSDQWGVGIPDASAYWLAEKENGILLTGDRRLTKKARREGVVVKGVLWVLDELVSRHIITPPKAATSLKAIMAQGARLPAEECAERLVRWENAMGRS